RLGGTNPAIRIATLRQLQQQLDNRLQLASERVLEKKTHALALLSGVLDRLSPLKTLERGYAIASLSDGRVVTDAAAVQVGDALALRLHRGELDCEVTGIHPETS
ncbi:MAG: exodeoxyribonuclease VII large subunit, partial [Nevskiales bacterium]